MTPLPPIAAAVWSLCYGSFGLLWAAGGPGYPFGSSDRAQRMGAVLVDLPSQSTGLLVATLGLLGALVSGGLAVDRGGGRGPAVLRAVAACLGVLLLVVVPDGRLLLAVGELIALHPERIETAAVHQAFCALGSGLLILAARTGVSRGVRGAHSVRRERVVSYLAAAIPLLYVVPRLLWALGWTVGVDGVTAEMVTDPVGRHRELVFAAAAAVGGLLTLGLTHRWGTRFPAAVPRLGGRRVPPSVATVPAGLVALLLIGAGATMWRALLGALLGTSPPEEALSAANWGAWLGNLAWLPWGVTLALATQSYRRRRAACAPRSAGPDAPALLPGRTG